VEPLPSHPQGSLKFSTINEEEEEEEAEKERDGKKKKRKMNPKIQIIDLLVETALLRGELVTDNLRRLYISLRLSSLH